MSIRSLLLASSALALMSGTAFAEQNFSNVVQDGSNNSGFVTQDGSSNDVGTTGLAATQDGNANVLDFLQDGADNEIGTAGTGFRQDSNRNTAEIDQSGDGNRVLQVQQTGISSNSGGIALRRNTLTIDQGGTGANIISRVTQTRTSGFLGIGNGAPGNVTTLTQTGDGNIIGDTVVDADGVTQNGYRHETTVTQAGSGNRIENIRQIDVGQQATVTQTGEDNVVVRVDQRGATIAQPTNQATLSFFGNRNGAGPFSITSGANGAWGSLSQGEVFQSGGRNTLGFSVTGDDNLFGFDQEGDNDIAGTVEGSRNQTGAQQLGLANLTNFDVTGDDNDLFVDQSVGVFNIANEAFLTVVGSRNAVGVRQSTTDNAATVTISSGNDNTVNLFQESLLLGNDATVLISGDANTVTGDQSGLAGSNALTVDIAGGSNDVLVSQDAVLGLGTNVAVLTITGSNNLLDVTQTLVGFGPGNTLTVDITGDDNNRGSFTPNTPAALTAAGLTPGEIIQSGSGNTIGLTVGDTDPNSNANLFAFSQTGDGNGIDGSINGIGNQVAIVQAGNNNYASFSQVGNFNSIGIGQ